MKCELCNKKINLVEQEYCKCQKCNKKYCYRHRMPNILNQKSDNVHICDYNYFEQHKIELKHLLELQPISEKIVKI